jgi:hypothetical protein
VFSRPYGTWSVFPVFPALKRRAIFGRPFGAGFTIHLLHVGDLAVDESYFYVFVDVDLLGA